MQYWVHDTKLLLLYVICLNRTLCVYANDIIAAGRCTKTEAVRHQYYFENMHNSKYFEVDCLNFEVDWLII